MAKAPEPGMVKTRLAAGEGDARAAELARAFLVDTWSTLARGPYEPTLVLAGRAALPQLEPPPVIWEQGEGDLGARLERAFQRALRQASWAIAIGTDSPGLPRQFVDDAVSALTKGAEAVLGPTDDGGYYLIGLSRCPTGLFDGVPWSTEQAYDRTRERLQQHHLRPVTLERWYDVDDSTDLVRLQHDLERGRIDAPATARALASAR